MEPAVRGARVKSAIITGRARNGALLASQDSQNSRQPTGIGRQNPAAGNGIFGCRDGRLKSAQETAGGRRRLNERNDTCKNPHRNALSGAGPGIRGSVGLDGGVRSPMRTGLGQPVPVIPCYPHFFRDKDSCFCCRRLFLRVIYDDLRTWQRHRISVSAAC